MARLTTRCFFARSWMQARPSPLGAIDGSVSHVMAIAFPVLLLLAGGLIDYTQSLTQKRRLQDIADKAAIAAARELGLSDAKQENVPEVVAAVVASMMAANGRGDSRPTLKSTVTNQPLEVAVSATQTVASLFGSGFGFLPTNITVNSVARIVGQPNICVLGLDPASNGTISLEKNAKVTAQNCAVFSNSRHVNSIQSKNSAVLSASLICAAGGKDGTKGNFAPDPLTDCPSFDDPLASRPEPQAGSCDPSLPTQLGPGDYRLSPGTYCKGLTLLQGASVTLDPGIYSFVGGPLQVSDGARLKGDGVGLYFSGDVAVLQFDRLSSIELSAPTTGQMAGLLVFESRTQPQTLTHKILSDDARTLLGTIYLSRNRLHVDANKPIADKSAYTAIVARMLTLYGGPELVLNANYGITDVPVPEGIKGAGQPIRLVR